MTRELRSCPFCGGMVAFKHFKNEYDNDAVKVYCRKCFVEYQAMSEATCLMVWNNRVANNLTEQEGRCGKGVSSE